MSKIHWICWWALATLNLFFAGFNFYRIYAEISKTLLTILAFTINTAGLIMMIVFAVSAHILNKQREKLIEQFRARNGFDGY